MSANASPRARRRLRTSTIMWLVAAVVLCVLLLATSPWFITGYAALALATAVVLRQVSREPGSWLGRRGVRRGLVAVLGAVCLALLLSGLWWPSTAAPLQLLVLLILLDVALGQATQRVATAPDAIVDERQEALRNTAHVVSYRLLAIVLTLSLIASVATPQTRSWFAHSLTLGFAGYLQLLFGLPAMVLAWTEPDRLAPEGEPQARDVWAAASLPLLGLTIATPFLLSLALIFLPVHTTPWVGAPQVGYSQLTATPANCREFMAGAGVGLGVGAEIPLHAEACWDGSHAYEAWGMNPKSDCGPRQSFLTTVTTTRCTRTTSADGTLHFTYRAAVRPALLPFLVRELQVSVVIDRNGHVEQFP